MIGRPPHHLGYSPHSPYGELGFSFKKTLKRIKNKAKSKKSSVRKSPSFKTLVSKTKTASKAVPGKPSTRSYLMRRVEKAKKKAAAANKVAARKAPTRKLPPRNLKPKSNNYYDNEIINEFEIELNNLHEACEMQKIALHAGLIAEILENHMEQKYRVKFFDEHSSPNAIEVQRIAGIGNFAAYILVEDMERKKIVVRLKNNYCYKIYFA